MDKFKRDAFVAGIMASNDLNQIKLRTDKLKHMLTDLSNYAKSVPVNVIKDSAIDILTDVSFNLLDQNLILAESSHKHNLDCAEAAIKLYDVLKPKGDDDEAND